MPEPESSVDGIVNGRGRKTKWRRAQKHIKATLARLLLALHGIYCILKTHPSQSPLHWLMLVPIGLLPLEAWVTWKIHKGKEWKWICPCVVLYLLSTIPAISFLELDLIWVIMSQNGTTSVMVKQEDQFYENVHNNSTTKKVHFVEKLLGFDLAIDYGQEIRILEQLMLLFLIISRWILPRQQINAEQKSSLLIAYIGMSADILELFETFNEAIRIRHTEMIKVLLYIWACSIFQFAFVFTARKDGKSGTMCGLYFETEIWAVFLNLMMQDAPFLIVRLYFMIVFQSRSAGSVFFLVKNILVTLLIINRIYGIIISIKEEEREAQKNETEVQQLNQPLLGNSKGEMDKLALEHTQRKQSGNSSHSSTKVSVNLSAANSENVIDIVKSDSAVESENEAVSENRWLVSKSKESIEVPTISSDKEKKYKQDVSPDNHENADPFCAIAIGEDIEIEMIESDNSDVA